MQQKSMQPKFDAHNGNRFVPDFYLVGSHGCGRLSLSYYLSWLGALVSGEFNLEPTENNIRFPVPKNPQTYRYGLTVEFISGDFQPIGRENERPVIWMVRDPIKMLTSLYNYFLGDVVFGKGNPEVLLDRPLIPFFASHIAFSTLYSTLKNITNSTATPFVLQTEDLFADKCIHTLKNITEYLNIPFSDAVCDVANISFNSFDNRIWSRQPAKQFPLNVVFYRIPYYTAPDKIFDFWFNQWEPAKILSSFEYKSKTFTIGMPLQAYNSFSDWIPHNYFDAEKIAALKKYLEIWQMHCDLTRQLYRQYSISAEEALDAINANQKFKSRFLKLMDKELSGFASEYPHIVRDWEYFNRLL